MSVTTEVQTIKTVTVTYALSGDSHIGDLPSMPTKDLTLARTGGSAFHITMVTRINDSTEVLVTGWHRAEDGAYVPVFNTPAYIGDLPVATVLALSVKDA